MAYIGVDMKDSSVSVEILSGAVRVGEEVIPLYSGEFHFWRIQASNWEPILQKIRDMGLNVIATYIAWNFHEIAPGSYDFTGETCPERNLAGFLQLAQRMGFKLMLRPGPYIYSEWPNGGPTDEAAQYHRLDPRFKALAEKWIGAVCDIICPFLATRGGNVITIQLDNEPYPAIASQGTQLGCFGGHGVFKDWIASRYGNDIARLNAAWQTDHKDFETACIYWEEPYINRDDVLENGRLTPETEYETRIIDSQEFVEWYAKEILEWTAGVYREHGIDVPFVGNGWHPYAQNFHGMQDIAPLSGVDLYPSAWFKSSTWTPNANDWDYNMEALKVTENNCGWGYSAELECGVYEGAEVSREDINPEAADFMNRAFIANGLKAWNWYVIVNRDNWCHSPINQFGRETPYFAVHKGIIDLANKIGLHTLDRNPAVSLVTLRRQRLTDSGNWQNLWRALTESGVDFETVDCRYARPKCDLIFYGGSQFVEEDEAHALHDAVKNGATLVIFNRIPKLSRSGVNTDLFGMPSPDGQRPIMSPFDIIWDSGSARMPKCGHNGRVHTLYFNSIPEDAAPIWGRPILENKELLVDISATGASSESYLLGFVKQCGRGKVVEFGMSPCAAILPIVKSIVGCSYRVETCSKGTAVTMWGNAESNYIFVINRNPMEMAVELFVDRAIYTDATSLVNVETGRRVGIESDGSAYAPVKGYGVAVFEIIKNAMLSSESLNLKERVIK